MRALRSACLYSTTKFESPFIRADFTYSSGSTSSIADRVIRVALPISMNASTPAGRMRCSSASTVYGKFPAMIASITDMWVTRVNGGGALYSPDVGSPK
jgi:hypothetical protein